MISDKHFFKFMIDDRKYLKSSCDLYELYDIEYFIVIKYLVTALENLNPYLFCLHLRWIILE